MTKNERALKKIQGFTCEGTTVPVVLLLARVQIFGVHGDGP